MNDDNNDVAAFGGRIGRTRAESEPWWPEVQHAPKGAPNIVIVLMDDMGYSDPGCFGGEIDTPHIDALAARGLRFNHYTTHPICSPARAALLTGRNAHSVSTGWLANNNGGFPGYSGEIPKEAPTLAETLRAQGYGTMMVGKWHNTPTAQSLPSSPKDSWPTQRGFDWFYGFLGGSSFYLPQDDQASIPNIYEGRNRVQVRDHLTDVFGAQAARFIDENKMQPFFLYLSFNAPHVPLQAPAEYLVRFKHLAVEGEPGVMCGYTKRRIEHPRQVYAAMVSAMDDAIGRVLERLRQHGIEDNTMVVFLSDNGGPTSASTASNR